MSLLHRYTCGGPAHFSTYVFPGSFFSPQQHSENLYKAVWLQRQSYPSIPCISWLQNTASLNLSGVCCSVCLYSAFGPVWSVGSAYQPSVFHPLYCWVPASAPLLRSCLGPEMKPNILILPLSRPLCQVACWRSQDQQVAEPGFDC